MGEVTKEFNISSQTVIPALKEMKLVKKVWKPLVDFVPRPKLMEEINRLFSMNTNYIFVSGIGGSGKSELIRKYVSVVEMLYNNICMLDYHGSIRETINQGLFFYTNYNTSLEIEQQFIKMTRQEMFCKKMEILNNLEKCLIVIDNFENIEDENMQQLLDSNADIIILTREYIENTNVLDITNTMLEYEEIQLFKNNCTILNLNEEVIRELCKICYGHPMTIKLLATLVSQNKYELDTIFTKFQLNHKWLLSDEILLEKDRNFKNRKIKKHLETIISLYGLSEKQEQLLFDICFAYPQILPEKEYFLKKYGDIQKDTKLLQKLNLIYIETGEIHIHPLLAESVVEMLEPDLDRCRYLLNYFKEIFDAGKVDNYYLGFLASKVAVYLKEYDEKYQQMLLRGAKHWFNQSAYDASIQIYEYILQFLTNDFERSKVQYQIALNLKYIGRYQDSINIYQEIQEICKQYPDFISFKKIQVLVLIGIANDYHMLGEQIKDKKTKTMYFGSSLNYYKIALHISKYVDGVTSVRCASIYDNMALMYGNLKQFNHAYSNSALARKIFRKLEGEESFEMAKCYINLGEIDRLNGKLENALNSFKISEQIKKQVLPENHDSNIVTFINIGEILTLLKRFDEAETYWIKAQCIASLKFSRTHIYNSVINRGLENIIILKN